MNRTKIKGMENVLDNLNNEIKKMNSKPIKGLLKGGLIVEREANKRVPIETGVLRASSYTRKSQDNKQTVVVGYSSAYAIFVHENLEMKLKGKPRPSGLGVYWGPKGEAKFLENALMHRTDDVLNAVRESAKV